MALILTGGLIVTGMGGVGDIRVSCSSPNYAAIEQDNDRILVPVSDLPILIEALTRYYKESYNHVSESSDDVTTQRKEQ